MTKGMHFHSLSFACHTLSSNIPKKIFYSALVGEFLRIARATLHLSDFIPKATDLIKRMLNQGVIVNVLQDTF